MTKSIANVGLQLQVKHAAVQMLCLFMLVFSYTTSFICTSGLFFVVLFCSETEWYPIYPPALDSFSITTLSNQTSKMSILFWFEKIKTILKLRWKRGEMEWEADKQRSDRDERSTLARTEQDCLPPYKRATVINKTKLVLLQSKVYRFYGPKPKSVFFQAQTSWIIQKWNFYFFQYQTNWLTFRWK